jgi:hypothetical protein
MKYPEIKNFEKLYELLEKSKKLPPSESIWLINEMVELEGYEDWLVWMKNNRPKDLS